MSQQNSVPVFGFVPLYALTYFSGCSSCRPNSCREQLLVSECSSWHQMLKGKGETSMMMFTLTMSEAK